MLVARIHYGTKNLNFMMSDYVFRRNKEGVHIINLSKTWEKLVLAARIIAAIENPQDIIGDRCSRQLSACRAEVLQVHGLPDHLRPLHARYPSPTRSRSSSVSLVC